MLEQKKIKTLKMETKQKRDKELLAKTMDMHIEARSQTSSHTHMQTNAIREKKAHQMKLCVKE